MLAIYENCIIYKAKGETLKISAVDKNVIRIQGNYKKPISSENYNLINTKEYPVKITDSSVYKDGLSLQTGKTRVEISQLGELKFFNYDKEVLEEKYRNFGYYSNGHTQPLRELARSYKLNYGPYSLKVSFEANEDEHIYGMGVYQIGRMDLKGCRLDLAQKNTQISIPFFLSSRNYGFMWNNPSVGETFFGETGTEFVSYSKTELDYLFIGGKDYKDVIKNYTAQIGRPPVMDESLLGLWQSKLRYRTPEEILSVANKYKELGIDLSVIVIDYFHWTRQGEWEFDDTYWKDLVSMNKKLHDMNIKVMASIWPTVDKQSKYYPEMEDKGLLIAPIKGTQCYDFQGDCMIVDFTNPDSQQFVSNIVRKNYFDKGIDYLWLDQAEPEYTSYDLDNYVYHIGKSFDCSNIYPYYHLEAFQDKDNPKPFLIRSACFGSQKLGAILWSGDVQGTYVSFKDQFTSAINAGIAGMSWYTNDIGGFAGNVNDENWKETLIRWFEWMVFSPILRMHGDRTPWDIPVLDDRNYGGGFTHTGQANEIYSFGDEIYKILRKNLELRESLKPYIKSLFDEASATGLPLMRPLFLEFPKDRKVFSIEDEYMFGDKYLVCFVETKATEREVYLPKGTWKEIHTKETYEGNSKIKVATPLEYLPVFEKIN